MRVQLIVALLIASSASAQEGAVRVRSVLYQDDDATTVVTSAVEAEAAIGDHASVRMGYLMDAITTASVDVVAAATQRWDERRDEVRGGADVRIGYATASAGAVRSIENDYDSWTITLGGSVDLADRATTLALSGAFIDSDVGRADDPSFAAGQRTWVVNARLVQALSPEMIVAVGYGVSRVIGHQSSPYRHVRLGDGTAVLERHPTERLRHSLTLRFRRWLAEGASLGIDQRLYADDWGVLGTTTNVALVLALSDSVELELRNRFHYQRAASFWEERYDQQRRFSSADRELSTFFDDYAGPAIVWTAHDAGPFEELRADVRADVFYYRFIDYAYLDGRIGTLASIGLGGTW